jgi:hypothetical protein
MSNQIAQDSNNKTRVSTGETSGFPRENIYATAPTDRGLVRRREGISAYKDEQISLEHLLGRL